MQLLVSVRSGAEVEPALSGGADIIDAKEPNRGALGPVSTTTLIDIIERIPVPVPLSIALGDVSRSDEVTQAIAAVPDRTGPARCYVKLGFAGVSSPHRVRALLEPACAAARRHSPPLHVVAVAYADAELAGSVAPDLLCRVAAGAGVIAVLVDTHDKAAGNLLTRMPLPALGKFVAAAHRAGLLVAVAGGLESSHLALVGAARPDIVGFRGAACSGGREGRVSRLRVYRLHRAVTALGSASVRNGEPGLLVGETPEARANLSSIS